MLQTAARGAVEASLREWRFSAETTVRNQLESMEEANPDTLSIQLDQLESSMEDVSTPPEKQPLWLHTLTRVMKGLPPESAKAWQAQESARAAFKRDTGLRFAMESFNRVIYLTPEQIPKLQALLEEAVKPHEEELESRNSSSDSPWFLSSPENLTPFNHIPPAKLRALLTAQQWTGWSKSDAFVETDRK